jgi:hypothetical protein
MATPKVGMDRQAEKDILKAAGHRDGVVARSARVLRLKEELNLQLELVVHARESLENELSSEIAQKKLSIDKSFLSKLKELTACFNSLTDARIRLDKSEKALEKEMTPQEEKEAVRAFVASLTVDERYNLIQMMWRDHKANRDSRGARGDDELK